MKKILVPIDFSENAQKAIKAAETIASKTGAALSILHTYQPYVADISIPATVSSLPVYEELENSYKQQLDEYVAEAQALGYQAEAVWESDGIHTAILRQAKNTNADLIVLGRTGKGSFMDKLIGSAATGIATDAPCPVLVIPPDAATTDFKQVVYATQLEYEETDILRQVIQLAELLGAKLTFIKISSLEQPNIQPDNQYIEQMTAEFNIPASDIVIRTGGGVLDGIENYCKEVNADLLIVSTRERGFWEQFIINPSVTRKLVVETHVPLLVYHMKE
ncbi:hypothetical protein DYBT9275_02906 [Dyadobacter sp. CECT 9275]|uniref:UspA domain-containing protein n=1 Tax=Dyadobacter helix TaxID=2822344 RepID=A0A916JF28_9BACT|nr:universal stress protein [Dyadobacter sp. CECT 9275]CAG5002499.1 hypothetical protein DYBT9275_02906 [Dyadobacter sp. CECT 9275]